MNQIELKMLLDEAANPYTSRFRRNQIGDKLVQLAPIWLDMIVRKLYMDTINNRPDLLPLQFPFFAIVCGFRDAGSNLPNVDWSLM
ncbi:MAG: hypothetical protein A3H06_01025 [Candidatus Colwellbacteria bacterium RIFCSPLOWO2_12_FULL_44_13]|uniref:Uncharacterized protein n=1 Tax=Candidatus Colwellbacteria bacterium RIFCSPLOWO2_12_FULL_44_13 TaxID=1797694 RepID=A0A1G1ZB30_9BACT|nr:MAG: hypothetical protein A3H06_01025 [Candidatus Colwellbacteria bacterium RIFCSPLOWO2_12_FULL_44_13]